MSMVSFDGQTISVALPGVTLGAMGARGAGDAVRAGTMLPSTAPILHLKEVPAQASVPQRKSGAANFFQYFTQRPSRAWVGRGARHIPHEVTEILKEEIYPHSANGLRPHFLQVDGVKPLKEAPGAPGIDNVTLTRPRDPGPGARAALTRLPCRPLL